MRDAADVWSTRALAVSHPLWLWTRWSRRTWSLAGFSARRSSVCRCLRTHQTPFEWTFEWLVGSFSFTLQRPSLSRRPLWDMQWGKKLKGIWTRFTDRGRERGKSSSSYGRQCEPLLWLAPAGDIPVGSQRPGGPLGASRVAPLGNWWRHTTGASAYLSHITGIVSIGTTGLSICFPCLSVFPTDGFNRYTRPLQLLWDRSKVYNLCIDIDAI